MTNLLQKNEQTGRSMVEMLGVLAIIGVLSVGGISGYSKAMTKFKITKTFDQVTMMVANIRTLYSGQRNYKGLATAIAIDMGVVPAEMSGPDSKATANTIQNAFQGDVAVSAIKYNEKDATAFYISYGNLGREACVSILTADWGAGTSSGFLGIKVESSKKATSQTAVPTAQTVTSKAGAAVYGSLHLPVTPAEASVDCQCTNDECAVTWFYL